MNHINYTYNQIKNLKNEKLEKFRNFLHNKKIIFIISEKYLKREGGFGRATPCDIINLLFDINNSLTIYLLDSILNEKLMSKLFIQLVTFLGDKSFINLPYILFNYRHVTSFCIDGYIFINFSNNLLFSFESLISELNSNKNILSFENNFLYSLNIYYIFTIDNNSEKKFKITENKCQNKTYKNITISKKSLYENIQEFIKLCDLIREEITNKGYSIFINIENYDNKKNEWIYVIIFFITNIIHVNYLEVANYFRQKINFIKNISQIINNCLYDDFFEEIFNI